MIGRARRRLRRLLRPARLERLGRIEPVSRNWGVDRGTVIDRYYIELFLARHAPDIHGQCLEVKDTTYTDRFGKRVTSKDVLDISPANPRATIISDLAAADAVESDRFDCFILTQTLQYPRDPAAVIRHAHRILAPGGVLLLTAPCISRIGPGERPDDRWRFTDVGVRTLLDPVFGAENVAVEGFGNFFAAVAFLEGMAAEELQPRELAVSDPDYPIVIAARAVKSGAAARGSTAALSKFNDGFAE